MSVRLRLILAIIIGLLVSGCSDDWGVDQHARKVTAGELEGQWLLINYWAEWCGPCRMIAPALEEIAADLGDKVTIAKINIDENPDTPGKYGVRGIPTMLLFKNGEAVAQKVGAAPRSQIQQWLEGQL